MAKNGAALAIALALAPAHVALFAPIDPGAHLANSRGENMIK